MLKHSKPKPSASPKLSKPLTSSSKSITTARHLCKTPANRLHLHNSKRHIVRPRSGTPEFLHEPDPNGMRNRDTFKATRISYPSGDLSEFEPSNRTNLHQQQKYQIRAEMSKNRATVEDSPEFKQFVAQQEAQEMGQRGQTGQTRQKKSLFGDMDIKKRIDEDQSFMKPKGPNGKQLFQAVADSKRTEGTTLQLERQQLDKERIDLSALEVQPYLENLKGAIIHHDLEQLVASIGGILRFGGRADIFNAKVDNDETIIHKITQNNEKHKKEYRVMYDNVKALLEVISYDLETVSKTLNESGVGNKLHCSINTILHLITVYNIVAIPLNDPGLKTHHCSIDEIAQKIVQRSEDLDILENGPEVYKNRFKYPPIKIISPLLGAIYMMLLKRHGFTTGLVHTPMVGLVFATPPVSRKNIGTDNPDIALRTKQNSPYWFIDNLVTDHAQQYRKTNLKLTPVDCKGFCTPSFDEMKTAQQLAEDFTCSCLTQSEVGYGGNFLYIDYLVGKIGQIPYFYKPNNSIDALTTQGVELSSDVTHSKQDKFNWNLPYPIYSYKTLAMRLIYEPIFATDMNNQLGVTLELAANHLSSHIDNDSWRPKKVEVNYLELDPSSSDEDMIDFENNPEFQEFLREHQENPKF